MAKYIYSLRYNATTACINIQLNTTNQFLFVYFFCYCYQNGEFLIGKTQKSDFSQSSLGKRTEKTDVGKTSL